MVRAAEAAAEQGRSWWGWAGRAWQWGWESPMGAESQNLAKMVLWAGIRSVELRALILSQTN